MALPIIFSHSVSEEIINRINLLTPKSTPQWGKMDVSQMLAHCNVSYEMTFDDIHKKPNPVLRFILKTFVKDHLVNEKPYKRNSSTAPQFLIQNPRNFSEEKKRLIAYINKSVEIGESFFDNKDHIVFGKMPKTEWNNLFYKHLDHHLTQFGV